VGRSGGEAGGAANNKVMTVDDTPTTPQRHYQLVDLKADTQYTLIVRAQNALGWSDYSDEFIFRTAPGSPPPRSAHLPPKVAAVKSNLPKGRNTATISAKINPVLCRDTLFSCNCGLQPLSRTLKTTCC